MARPRTIEREALHGPWPADHDSEVRLTRLRRDHPGWRFWRAMHEDQTPGDWCAVRSGADGGQQLAALTADGLAEQVLRVPGGAEVVR